MLEIKLHPDYFNLVRTGKKRSTIRRDVRVNDDGTPQLGKAALVNSENENMRAEILVHRVAYTCVGLLTTEDAERDGFLNLAQLLDAMRRHYSDLNLSDVVTIYYFDRTDRDSG